jgi:pseudouridine synthase
VAVNGQPVTQLGQRLDPARDAVRVDGKPVAVASKKRYVLLNKPKGVVTTRHDERGRKTVLDLLPEAWRDMDPAGRLDRDTSGALILSNDGDFVYQVTHPRFHLPKLYRVTLSRPVAKRHLETLVAGVELHPEGVLAQVAGLERLAPEVLLLTLVTGYNRQIRRTLALLGYEVRALHRVGIGELSLSGLRPGAWRPLSPAERRTLTQPKEAGSFALPVGNVSEV